MNFIKTALVVIALAQTPVPQKFDVVSLRALESDAPLGAGAGGRRGGAPVSSSACGLGAVQISPGRLTMRDSTVVRFLASAYGKNCEVAIQEGLLTGLPDWALWQKFDLQATYPSGTSDASRQAMLQNMLAERFHLSLHRSSKEVAFYNLVATQAIKLKQSDPQAVPSPARPVPTEGLTMQIDNVLLNILSNGKGTITASSMPISTLLVPVPMIDGRVVVDKTGLTGLYDIPDVSLDVGPPERRIHELRDIWPKILQQLGLKLEPGKGPEEVLVVDRLEKPTEN